jgi:nucleoside permease NupC
MQTALRRMRGLQWLEAALVFALALGPVAFALGVDLQHYAPAVEVVRG